jgi:hypothetical protein
LSAPPQGAVKTPLSNERRHITSNERDMPWRLAVEDIARGVCRLSMTIRSFSSSDQRRRRPVSMTSSRST